MRFPAKNTPESTRAREVEDSALPQRVRDHARISVVQRHLKNRYRIGRSFREVCKRIRSFEFTGDLSGFHRTALTNCLDSGRSTGELWAHDFAKATSCIQIFISLESVTDLSAGTVSGIDVLWKLRLRAVAPEERRRGAGDGNRTRVASLENSCTTIVLHPQCVAMVPNWSAGFN